MRITYIEDNTLIFVDYNSKSNKKRLYLRTCDGTMTSTYTYNELLIAGNTLMEKLSQPNMTLLEVINNLIAEMMCLWCSVNSERYGMDFVEGNAPIRMSFEEAIKNGYMEPA